jgi:hypothetical protein
MAGVELEGSNGDSGVGARGAEVRERERARQCAQRRGGNGERAGAVHRRRGRSWRRSGVHAVHAAPLR